MKFSTKAEYGLRAIVNLDKTGKKPVSLAFIAKKENLSLAYLERLFAKLKKSKIVKSELGPKGGYVLAKLASKITLLDVLESLEGSIAPQSCVGEGRTCEVCNCKIHPVWDKLYKEIRKTLTDMKLNSIM